MKVVLFLRKSFVNQHSIERVYRSILPFLEKHISIEVCVMPFRSKGLVRRFLNGLYAWTQKGDINHISGDINYVASFLPSKGSILTIHDIYPMYSYKGWKKKAFELFWLKLPISRIQQIIFISEFTCREVLSNYIIPKDKYVIISNAVSPDFCYKKPRKKEVLIPNIMHIGVKENKNLQRVIEALSGIECKLILVGKPDSSQVEKLKHHKVEYEYHEAISNEELNLLYALSDIVLFVSTYEGFGLPIVEAQAVGRPIITSNLASMPEIAGRGALFVNPYSVDEIRAGIMKILSDEKYMADLVTLGQENVKRFNPKYIGEEYLKVYKKIASS